MGLLILGHRGVDYLGGGEMIPLNFALMEVSEEVILKALGFPEGTRILTITREPPPAMDVFEFLIANDQLPKFIVDASIPRMRPVFKTTFADCGHVEKVEVKDWGILP